MKKQKLPSATKREVPPELLKELKQAQEMAEHFDRKGIVSVWHSIRDRLLAAVENYQLDDPKQDQVIVEDYEIEKELDNGTLL